MSVTRTHTFDTAQPVRLRVQLDRGRLTVTAQDSDQTRVGVRGEQAGEVSVEQDGDTVTVSAPRRLGFVDRDLAFDLEVVVPTGSDLEVRTGTADLHALGRYGAALLRSGSGAVEVEEVTGPAQVETGSGDVHLGAVHADLQVKSGSGEVVVDRAVATVAVSTGSGDVRVGVVDGDLAVKTGSGDLHAGHPRGDVAMTTGSGDVVVEQAAASTITLRGASGDAHVGVPADLPVWTDVTTLSGVVHATTARRGAPADGQPHLSLRVTTVSGDVHLTDV